MDTFPWWTEEQKEFAVEVKKFADEMIPRDEESRWKREFPRDIFVVLGEKGYLGAGIPKEYGGMGLGATGACILTEEISRMPALSFVFGASLLGGLRQIIEFGTEEQKKRFLPRIAKGEMGAICITEAFAGTDASAIETTAKYDGKRYVINGKKRFIVSAGTASRHLFYARTSDNPEDIRQFRHLTAFVVERGMPGFTVEKVNEVIGFENAQNGVLNLDEVPVPVENRIGQEGEGWRVMTAGLNFERTLISAQVVGWIRELVRYAVPYAQRRVQFGRPTIDFVNNQFKVADLLITLKMARLTTYYTAYLWDLGWDISVESNVSKVFNCEGVMKASLDAIQVMGGDGLTAFNPLGAIMNVSKVNVIAGGTMEACRLVIYRMGLRLMADYLRMPHRTIHQELGVPVSTTGNPVKESQIDEDKLLRVLAEDYRINPGLHMSREDLKGHFDVDDKTLDGLLTSFEQKKWVKLYRGKKGIELAKATYAGLKKAYPSEYYRWFPSWVKKEDLF
jgi:alkylation response protein AidB-like acyl-CoA dehydrogenase